MWMFVLVISCLITSNLPWFMDLTGSYAILFLTVLDFTFTIRHNHNWVSFLLWLSLFFPSGAISLFFSSGVSDTYWPGGVHLSVSLTFCVFILFMGLSSQECWSGLPFPSPMDHVLSELSTMTHPPWVAIHSMAHNFIESDNAVVHVISLISFLSFWFSFCLSSEV